VLQALLKAQILKSKLSYPHSPDTAADVRMLVSSVGKDH